MLAPSELAKHKMLLHRYVLSRRHVKAMFRAMQAINSGVAVSLLLLLLGRNVLLRCAKAHIDRHLATLTLDKVVLAAAHLTSCIFHPFLPSSPVPYGAAAAVTPGAATVTAGKKLALPAIIEKTFDTFWDAWDAALSACCC